MIVLATAIILQTGTSHCATEAGARYQEQLTQFESKLRSLLADQKAIASRRRSIAESRVVLAEIPPIQRSLKRFGNRNYDEKELDRLDSALMSQSNTILDETRVVAAQVELANRDRLRDIQACEIGSLK